MLSCSHFVKKTFIHLTHSALMPIFRQEYVHFQKTQRSDVIFQYFMKNPLLLYPYLVKKRQFCQNYAMWLPKKVSRMLIFPFCIKKLLLWCQKNLHSLKITMLSFLYFVRKTSLPSKTRQSHVISFIFFIKTHCCHDIFD